MYNGAKLGSYRTEEFVRLTNMLKGAGQGLDAVWSAAQASRTAWLRTELSAGRQASRNCDTAGLVTSATVTAQLEQMEQALNLSAVTGRPHGWVSGGVAIITLLCDRDSLTDSILNEAGRLYVYLLFCPDTDGLSWLRLISKHCWLALGQAKHGLLLFCSKTMVENPIVKVITLSSMFTG